MVRHHPNCEAAPVQYVFRHMQAAGCVTAVVAARCARTSTECLFAAVHGIAVVTPQHMQVYTTIELH